MSGFIVQGSKSDDHDSSGLKTDFTLKQTTCRNWPAAKQQGLSSSVQPGVEGQERAVSSENKSILQLGGRTESSSYNSFPRTRN